MKDEVKDKFGSLDVTSDDELQFIANTYIGRGIGSWKMVYLE